MPALAGFSHADDEEEPINVTLFVAPRPDLPVKEWQVEIEQSQTMLELKDVVSQDYPIFAEAQRLCTTNNATDPGVKDHVRISDLPNHSDGKKIYLLPKKGKEEEFLDGVLEWAYRAECLGDYEKHGCVYNPKASEDDGLMMGKRVSIQSQVSGMLREQSSGFFNHLGKMKKRRSTQTGKSVAQVSGDGRISMEDPPPPFCEKVWFNLSFSIIASVNMVVVALEADYSCWGLDKCAPGDRMMWYAFDCIFAILFVIELSLRIVCHGAITFFLGDPIVHTSGFNITNCVDFLVVFFRFLDTFAFDQAGIDTKLKILSCFRIMQFARVARSLRLSKAIKELWLLVAGLADLGKTVAWVLLLLIIIFWVTGIVMTILVGHSVDFFDYSRSDWGKSSYFDTVPKSVFSLFQIMTLSNWSSVIVRPIQEEYPAMFVLFIPFLCICTIGLLNIIVGVVVESTLTSAAVNAEKEGKELVKTHARVMESLKMVFEEADTDGSGFLDRQELHKAMRQPHVRDRMKLLDIPVKDLDQLFNVLDEENVGEIRTDHFFRGCSRLRGPALACDLHRMSVDFSRYIGWTDDLVNKTRDTNAKLSRLLHDMESVDRDIIKGESDDCDPVLGCRRDRSAKRDQMWKNEQQQLEAQRAETKATAKTSLDSRSSRRSSRKNSLLSRTLTGALSDLGVSKDPANG